MLESCSMEPSILEFSEVGLFSNSAGPIWILGEKYSADDEDAIRSDLSSRLWFSYRKGFSAIGGTGPTSDQGWGCMLRCGQMLLAHTLIVRHLGRDWRWQLTKSQEDRIYLNILRLFEDKKDRLYSLQQIAQMGVSEGKAVGQWFGPNTVAQVLKKLCIYDEWGSVRVHVAMDSTVVMEDVLGAPWRPLLLIVPLRLGLSTLNPCYVSSLQRFFSMRHCAGILGGRPNHALYFVGVVDDELLYLDPHETQAVVDVDGDPSAVDDSSFHCPFMLHMPICSLDPSLALGFFCPTEPDLRDLCHQLRRNLLQSPQSALFELLDKRPVGWPKYVPYVGEETPKLSEFTVVEPHLDTDDDFEILA